MAFTTNPMFAPENLLKMSAAMFSAPTFAQGLGGATDALSTSMTATKEKQKEETLRNTTADMLAKNAPDIAENVRTGALSASDGLRLYYQQKKDAEEAAKPKYITDNGRIIRLDESTGKTEIVGDYSTPKEKKRNLVSTKYGIYDADTNEWVAPPEGAQIEGSEYGLNPQTAVDKDGNPVLVQLSKDGKAIQSKLPDGVTLSKAPIKLDAGTHFVLLDPVTRQNIGTIPKDIAGAKEQELLGKNTAELKAILPSARLTARQVGEQIASLKADSALSSAVGPWDSRMPTMFASTARAESKIEQLKGGAFLQARELLRGGGQITDYEGQKAEAAMARLSTAQSEEDFKAALDDFNTAVQDGLAKLEAAAEGKSIQPTKPGADARPDIEALVNKHRSKAQ